MSLARVFNDGDLLYGLRDDVQSYLHLFSIKRPELRVLTQSHINKYLAVGMLDQHQAHMKEPDGKKASIAAMLSRRENCAASYGSFSSDLVETEDPALQRAISFCDFLKQNYRKHDLTLPAGQCHFFKRLCKQGVMAAKAGQNHVHFVLDSLYSHLDNLFHIFNKTHRYECGDCNHDSVTASELRFIYRNRETLKGTVRFWFNDVEVLPPWETYPEIHDMYPMRKQKEAVVQFLACDPQCECCDDAYHFTEKDILVDARGGIAAMICSNTQNILFYNPFAYEKSDAPLPF